MNRICYRHSMALPPVIRLIAPLPLVALASCAAPKAVAVADPPQEPKQQMAAAPVDGLPKAFESREPRDGIRLPDNFLSMPGENEFRRGIPANSSVSQGAVTARPPSNPVIPPDIGPKAE